jgi:hypothetical protein
MTFPRRSTASIRRHQNQSRRKKLARKKIRIHCLLLRRTSLSRVAGWVLTADRTALSGRQAVRHRLLSERQLGCSLVCGSPEHTASVEPEASRQGSRSRSELPGHRYHEWIASGADSDEAVSFGPHLMLPPGPVPRGRFASRSPPLRSATHQTSQPSRIRFGHCRHAASARESSWAGRQAGPLSAGRLAPLDRPAMGDDPSHAGRCAK